jgi:uncharacterized protein YggE
MTRLRLALVASLAFAPMFLAIPGPAMAQTQTASPQRLIAMTGTGEVSAAPDMVTVTVGVVEQAEAAAAALNANTAKMTVLLQALKDAGIADKDVQTSNFSVNPRYEFDQTRQTQKMVGYEVSNQVTIRLRKIADLGGLLDRLVQAGSNQVNGISFGIADTSKLEDEARRRATENARHKAEVYAKAAGVEIGKVVSISETTSYRPPMPMVAARRMQADAAPVPIAAGEASVSASVDVMWELK